MLAFLPDPTSLLCMTAKIISVHFNFIRPSGVAPSLRCKQVLSLHLTSSILKLVTNHSSNKSFFIHCDTHQFVVAFSNMSGDTTISHENTNTTYVAVAVAIFSVVSFTFLFPCNYFFPLGKTSLLDNDWSF